MPPEPTPANVTGPGQRAAVVAVAADARRRLEALTMALGERERGFLSEAPLRWATALLGQERQDSGLLGVNRALATIAGRVSGHGPEWQASYAQLLVLALLSDVETRRPVIAIPVSVWPHVEAGLATVLAEAGAPGWGSDWKDEFFQKDFAVALLQAIPFEGLAGTVERHRPWRLVRWASWKERLALLRYLRTDFFRRSSYFNRHQWRGYRGGYRRPWQILMLVNADVLGANPTILGVFGTGWPFDPALSTVSPRLAERAEAFRTVGARSFRMRTNANSVEWALMASSTRRELFEAGEYRPAKYGLIVHRRDLLRWAAAQDRASWQLPPLDKPAPAP
jgi:hypothetical protein